MTLSMSSLQTLTSGSTITISGSMIPVNLNTNSIDVLIEAGTHNGQIITILNTSTSNYFRITGTNIPVQNDPPVIYKATCLELVWYENHWFKNRG